MCYRVLETKHPLKVKQIGINQITNSQSSIIFIVFADEPAELQQVFTSHISKIHIKRHHKTHVK